MWLGNRRRASAIGPLALVLTLVSIAPAAAQRETGSIAGVVRDRAGDPLAQAQVVVPRTGRGTLADARGRFRLEGVEVGEHEIRAERIGYAPARASVRVGGGATTELTLVLERTPLDVAGVQVTATVTGKDPLAVAQATATLAGAGLDREMGGTVAQTLSAQPGIAVRSMGPAASMPVMRGLTGDRVLVLQDGQRTADLAGSADDHGVTIDPLAARRVEVVRGPAALLYGNGALGGVVNVITGDIPTEAPSSAEWSVAAHTESAYPGGTGSVRGVIPLGGGWALAGRGGARSTGDVRIPRDPVLGDRLENTGFRSRHAALGAGWSGAAGTGGAAVRVYRFQYGLPVPPEAENVGLTGGRVEAVGRWEATLGSPTWPTARLTTTVQQYAHDELATETGAVLQRFELATRTAGLVLRQGRVGPFDEGAWGMSGLWKEYAATGPAALTPPATSWGVGAFGYQQAPLGLAGATLQLGGRLDRYAVASRDHAKFGPGVERVFDAWSGSVGATLPLGRAASLGASVARAFRAPAVEELFSAAAHAGTGAVEFGNAALVPEVARSGEVVARVQSARWNGQLAAYRNSVGGYVHLEAAGDSLVGGTRLPVLRYTQADAVLQGVEGTMEWAATRALVLGLMGDYLHAERVDGRPLSFMPPPRVGALVRWDDGRASLGVHTHHELRQDRVGAADELPTPAHTTLRLTAGYRLRWAGQLHAVTLRAENLGDELHREATSRIKDFAPGPGRNLALLYRVSF